MRKASITSVVFVVALILLALSAFLTDNASADARNEYGINPMTLLAPSSDGMTHSGSPGDLAEPPIKDLGPGSRLAHTSIIFTVADVVFFSYADGTALELYNTSGTLVWNNGGAPLNRGEHAVVTVPQGVYRATGSEKFTVLTGDPITNYVSGYYAMDQDGFGTSTELYTWVPQLYSHCEFIVFAYEDDTTARVEYTDSGIEIATFTLNRGEHWSINSLSAEWLHVTADKKVSALTAYDQGYFVPDASGKWSGTEFYTYVSDISGWPQDLTVISFNDGTTVTIEDSDSGTVIWSGTLNEGEPHVLGFPSGIDQYFTINSSNTVTVAVQPWVSSTGAYHQGAYIQDRNGAGVGIDLIGSTLSGGYLYILAYKDDTSLDVYNSQTGSWVANYSLDRGEFVQANPGNGLWRIISDKYVSAYSGWGQANADFAPVEFGAVVNALNLSKDDGLAGGCVNAGANISYQICFDNLQNDIDVTNVMITDELPAELAFVSASDGGHYNSVDHTVSWSIGTLAAQAPMECVELVAQVLPGTPENTVIANVCTIESDETTSTTVTEESTVCEAPDNLVDIDIQPLRCPNVLDVTPARCQVKLVVLGTANFAVGDIDLSTPRLLGVEPYAHWKADLSTPVVNPTDPCDCNTDGPDGYEDLVLLFSPEDVMDALGDIVWGEQNVLTLTLGLVDGTTMQGEDCLAFTVE